MLKTYTLDDGFSFKTITLPKGTILFRGIQYTDLTPREHISEFVGHHSCVPPTKNVYFYPVPYVAMAVNIFNVHILYTTNYDLELLLLVRPSAGFKPDGQEEAPDYSRIITICTNVSPTNSCGHPMSEDDPCFTPFFLDNFPHISGYIGLDAGDVDSFLGRYRAMVREGMTHELRQLVSALVSNNRDITGIPEIVIHPLHLRRNKTLRVKNDFSYPFKRIQSIIMNRAKWNYTPLLYVTGTHIFSLPDLLNEDNLAALRAAKDINQLKENPLFANLSLIMDGLSSVEGYTIDGHVYRIKLDLRTGFYQVLRSSSGSTRRVRNIDVELFESDTMDNWNTIFRPVKYTVSPNTTRNMLNDVKRLYLMDVNEDYVNKFLHSFLAYTVFERGRTITKYRLEEVFSRPDLPRLSYMLKNQLHAGKTRRRS